MYVFVDSISVFLEIIKRTRQPMCTYMGSSYRYSSICIYIHIYVHMSLCICTHIYKL